MFLQYRWIVFHSSSSSPSNNRFKNFSLRDDLKVRCFSRSSLLDVFCEKVFLKNLQNSLEIPVSATLFNKFASLQPVTSLQKRNSHAISFPWILQNVWENIFKRINLGKSSVCHKRGKTVASIVVSKSEFAHLEILNIHSSTTHKKLKFIKTDCGSSSQW